jgi:hypothetical protein
MAGLETDALLRAHVYDVALRTGRIPLSAECATATGRAQADVLAAFARLAAGHELVLQPDGEILMAMPFSAVPTPCVVQAGGWRTFANCGRDALGAAAMLGRPATVLSSCGDCGAAIRLDVDANGPRGGGAVLHLALPVREWWRSIVFT